MSRFIKFILVFGFVLSAIPSYALTFMNGNFEDNPEKLNDTVTITDAANIAGWETTASDSMMEIWKSGFNGVKAYEGNDLAELNASQTATLYQEVDEITAGSALSFEFAHRGRVYYDNVNNYTNNSADTMKLTITDFGNDKQLGTNDDTILFSNVYTDGTDAWGFYTSENEDPIYALGNTIRFAFESIIKDKPGNYGNFLDAVNFSVEESKGNTNPVPTPEPATILLLATGLTAAFFGRRKFMN